LLPGVNLELPIDKRAAAAYTLEKLGAPKTGFKMTKILSSSVEDYLKTIYELQRAAAGERVSTSAVADTLGVSSASVTGMLKKLSEVEPQLVDYQRYQGVRLTDAGEKIALEVLRHHRLIEAYLIEALGYTWDEVHDEADMLEHVISESLEARIADYLGHPQVDPHGDPIPTLEGRVLSSDEVRLTDLSAGERGTITRVIDDPELLRYLAKLKMQLSAEVEVTERGPFDGPLHVRVAGEEPTHALSRTVTDRIYVSRTSRKPAEVDADG
jgi:DtxR family Mn-dependent transcriptional regulator